MTKTYDCLFLHPNPHFQGKPFMLVMPMGIIALASKLSENGFETKILHLGLEELLDDPLSGQRMDWVECPGLPRGREDPDFPSTCRRGPL